MIEIFQMTVAMSFNIYYMQTLFIPFISSTSQQDKWTSGIIAHRGVETQKTGLISFYLILIDPASLS